MLPAETPFRIFTGLDGKPLDSGYVYFGQPGQNPITNQVTVYWDSAATQPAKQPLRTMNGYIVRAGTPANVFFDGAYSELVQDSKGRQVFYSTTSDEFSIATQVLNMQKPTGSSSVGFIQSGIGAIARTVQGKGRDVLDAADFITTPGASDSADQTGVQAAVNEANARGGGVVRVRAPIRTTWDLSTSLTIPAGVIIEDDRYNSSGWKMWHEEGQDGQLGFRGRASATGEGPSIVLQNLASTGNRNVSFVHWYGPTTAPVVGSFEHWGYNSDNTWYAGREWLSRGSIDTGSRARYRLGNDGGAIWNPNGDANSYKNNPAVGFTQDYLFVFNAPLQTGYAYSAKNLMNIRANAVEIPTELDIVGTNPPLRFKNAAGANRFALIGDFPSAGQIVLYDHILSANKQVWTSGGDTSHTGTFKSAGDNVDNLGAAANRWATVFAGTGTINTSDERSKVLRAPDASEMQPAGAIDQAVLRAVAKIDFRQFKFKDAIAKKGNAARWHIGVIAQQVKAAFESEGLDPFAYGVLCYDEWPEEWIDHPDEYRVSPIVDADGRPQQVLVKAAWREKVRDAGNRYGIRYEEALTLECAFLRSKLGV